MSESLDRLIRISRWGEVITKVLMIIMVIGIVAGTVALVYIAVNPDFIITAVSDGALILNVPIEDIDISAVAWALILGLLVLGVLVTALLYFTGRLFGNIYDNKTPFTDDNARILMIMAILIVVCTIATPILDFAVQNIIDATYYQSYGFGVFPLFVALILYVLSLVFKHGAELQRESDHTL